MDFILDCTILEEEPTKKDQKQSPEDQWTIFVDGSSSLVGLGARLILISHEGSIAKYALFFEFSIINNKVSMKP